MLRLDNGDFNMGLDDRGNGWSEYLDFWIVIVINLESEGLSFIPRVAEEVHHRIPKDRVISRQDLEQNSLAVN